MSEQITPNPSVPSQVVQEIKFPQVINNLGIIPTSYKDSMDYYQTLAWLCKYLEETVIPTLNQNGSAVQELQGLYIELNSYVTHYFDTLDVQEEINNKLDDLVEDGTLTRLLSVYVEPELQEVRNEMESVKDRMDRVASGSPAGIYPTVSDLTSADPDHDRIYLVNADGKWYYYDTTDEQWTAGGIYQASVNFQTVTDLNEDIIKSKRTLVFEQGSISSAGDKFNSDYTIRTNLINLKKGTYIRKKSNLVRINLFTYDSWNYGATYLDEFNQNIDGNYVSDRDRIVAITVAYTGGSAILPEVGNDLVEIYDIIPNIDNGTDAIYYADDYGCIPNNPDFDNSVPLQILINAIVDYGGVIKFGKGIYYFESGIKITNPTCLSIEGTKPFYNKLGTAFKYLDNDELITVYGGDNFIIKNIGLYGSNATSGLNCGTAILFADNDTTGEDCRLDQVIIENVNCYCFDYGFKIDCPTGYVYFNRCRTTRTGIAGISIGKDYANTYSVIPGYIYITECNIEGRWAEKNSKGIAIYGGQWIWIDKCDICNFGNAENINDSFGLYLNSTTTYIDNIKVTNNSFFNNINSVGIFRDNLIKQLKFANNDHNLANWGKAYVGNVVTNTTFIHAVIISNENFSKYGNNLSNIFAFTNVYDLAISNCVFDYEITKIYNLCYFTNTQGRFNRIDLFEHPVNRFTLSANETKTVTIDNSRSLAQGTRPIVIGTNTYSSSFDTSTGITTIALTNEKDEECVINVLFGY